jgi:hypothetical protein
MKATIERIFGAVYSTKPGRLGMGALNPAFIR